MTSSDVATPPAPAADRSTAPSGPAVVTRGLTKRFSRSEDPVVANVDLRIERGMTFGLLGPNGAGKSTTLRMLVDLVRPSSGDIEVLGEPAGGALRRIGTVIEDPALYPQLSGRRHLSLLADLSGVDRGQVDEVLEMVGLHSGVDRATGSYSTGMRQRLAIAAALLGDPELLILDEPSAGLDPEGVAEVRGLLRDVGRGDRTILLSSHLLSEVDQVCDHLGVLLDGELVYQGAIAELVAGDPRIVVRAEPSGRAAEVMAVQLGAEPERVDDRLVADGSEADVPELARRLTSDGVDVFEIALHERSLEEAYLALTREAG